MPNVECFRCNGPIGMAHIDREVSVDCAYCGAAVLLYKCFSCMKVSVLGATALPQTCPRCFTLLRTNRPLVLKPFPAQLPKTVTLASFPDFCVMMNQLVGEGRWVIVGGYASYVHIETYDPANKDPVYLKAVESQILPGDMEVALTEAAEDAYKKRYAQVSFTLGDREILVTTFPKPALQFQDDVQSSESKGAYSVHTPAKIIAMYKIGGDPQKKDKRMLRSAILTVISKGKRIEKATVEPELRPPMLGALNLANPMGGLRKVGVASQASGKDPGK